MQFTHSPALAKLAGCTLGLVALVSGGVALGASWATGQVEHGIRMVTAGSDGPITWGSLDSETPPEKVDLSTLIIAGTIDPATGAVTDVTPHPAAAAR